MFTTALLILRSLVHNQEKKKFFKILLLRLLRHDKEKKVVFFHLVTPFTTP